jgi:hypothetical protein
MNDEQENNLWFAAVIIITLATLTTMIWLAVS